MDLKLAGLAVAVQTLAVVLLSLLLVALPLPEDFFRDFGFVAGPAAWAVCAVLTARILALPVVPVLLVALLAGLVGTAISLVGGHWPGVAGLKERTGAEVLALSRGDGIRTRDLRLERPTS